MSEKLSRRDVLRILGVTGLGVGMANHAIADEKESKVKPGKRIEGRDAARPPVTLTDGKVIQPQYELPVLHQTDVLVVGAGPAGVAAAVAAKRAGVNATIVERYNHFGGQWTGGLVLVVMAMWNKDKVQVTRGVGEEILLRLDKMKRGIINRRPGVLPTVDAEATKYAMLEMIDGVGVDVFLHCWGVDAVLEGDAVRGAVIESKSGRQAILAKIVVDATGDGDIFAAAGAPHEHRPYHIGLVSRIANLDKVDPAKVKEQRKALGLGSDTPVSGVNWINMQGPDADACSVRDLTKLEIDHRKAIWKKLAKIQETPGFEGVDLIEVAPQLGVRISRVLDGMGTLNRKDATSGATYPDVIGYGGICYGLKDAWAIPYGALVPKKGEGILAAGRCISGEAKMADPLRLIAPCFVTGHAAGAAAALAVKDGCKAREVDVTKLQKLLREQGAYLG
ncbi:MAG: FAD-dependent oxidoreductase [Planctomycetota bacterium]